jgi:AcrR family transcriptional regulator
MTTDASSVITRPLRRDAAHNQELVLAAAREVLGESGTEATMDMIAARAGVGVGTVYRRFASKDALVAELVRIILDELIEAAGACLDRGDGSGLETFLSALGRSFVDHRRYADHLMGKAGSEDAATLRTLIAELHAQAHRQATIDSAITLADVMTTIWALRGVVGSAGDFADDAWQRHLEIHLTGLRPRTGNASLPPGLTPRQLAQLSGVNGRSTES